MYTHMYTVEEDFLLRLLIFIDIKSRYGAPGRNRTCNPRLRRPVLYPVELRARMIRWPFSSDESACILHEFHSLAMGSACLGGIALIGGVLALGLFVIVIMFVRGSGAAYSGVHT